MVKEAIGGSFGVDDAVVVLQLLIFNDCLYQPN